MKWSLFATLALALFAIPQPADAQKPEPAKPTSHTKRDVEGWTVHVDDRLLEKENEALGQRCLRLLSNQLYSITLVVPEEKLKRLRKVPLWLDLTHGKLKVAQYHPGADWLIKNGYSRELAKCVHFPDASDFVDVKFQRAQPWAVLHELAHAYHDQVLGFNHPEVKSAWQKLVDGGKYKSVLHANGRQRPHYALTNQMEFFAEMTEAYFGQNDFFPFNSAELQREEPEIFALLRKLWGPLP
jgi:hypothetical protein